MARVAAIAVFALLCVSSVLAAGMTERAVRERDEDVADLYARMQSADLYTSFGFDHGLDKVQAQGAAAAAFLPMDLSATCTAAFTSLVQAYARCNATFAAASNLFRPAPAPVPTQSDVHAFCGAQCKADFESVVAQFTAACTGLEILAIERASDGGSFRFYQMLVNLRLPCVNRPDTSVEIGKEYCLPAFVSLTRTFSGDSAGLTPTSLAASCKPCLAVFLANYTAYAAPKDVKNFAFVDYVCTRDGNTWCVLEQRALDALPNGNREEQIAKAQRTCSTTCLQRLLVKLIAAHRVFNQTGAELVQERAWYNALNGLCATNANGEYCAVTGKKFDDLGIQANVSGCRPPQCSEQCKTWMTGFLADQGCCYSSLEATVRNPQTGESQLAPFTSYVKNQCSLTPTVACPRVSGSLRAAIVLSNLRWVWYLANIAAFRAALLLDLAATIGSRADDIDATITQGTSSSALGFSPMAVNTIVVNVGVSGDTQYEVTSAYTALTDALSQGTLTLPGVSSLTVQNYDAKADAGQAVAVSYDSSSVTYTSTGTSSMTSAASSSSLHTSVAVAVVAAAAAAAAIVAVL